LILRRVWGFEARDPSRISSSWNEKIALAVPAIFILALGIYPEPALDALRGVVTGLGT
jgi:hypothetical protein